MEIKIVKEQRKSLMLKILSEDAILVKAPLRSADSAIQKFIDSKRGWIDRHLKKMKMLANFAKSFDFDNLIYENAIPIMETKSLRLDYERLSERTIRKKTLLINLPESAKTAKEDMEYILSEVVQVVEAISL